MIITLLFSILVGVFIAMLVIILTSKNKSAYIYKNNIYKVKQYGLMKNPITREWKKCVIYHRICDKELYVREFDDFIEKFKHID